MTKRKTPPRPGRSTATGVRTGGPQQPGEQPEDTASGGVGAAGGSTGPSARRPVDRSAGGSPGPAGEGSGSPDGDGSGGLDAGGGGESVVGGGVGPVAEAAEAVGGPGATPYGPGVGADAAPPERVLSPGAARALDLVITVGGLVVATLLAVAFGIIEAFLAPLHLSDLGLVDVGESNFRVPLAFVLAVITNPLLGWFAFTTTQRRLAALLPAAAWTVVWIMAAGRATEGDLVITDKNWVGLLTLFSGPVAFAVGIYVSAMRQQVGGSGSANSKASPLAPRSVER